jgi:hypothetical protein
MATATTAQLTQTRKQLRQAIARRLGDYIGLTATANGSTTTFTDTIRLAAAREALIGRQWVGTSGTNDGVVRTVSSGTTTLTLSAAVTSTVAADTADLYNKRGTGWQFEEYNAKINDVINDAAGFARLDVVSEIATAFDAEVPEVTAPVALAWVYAIEWEDDDGFWHAIPPMLGRFGGHGWETDPAAGQVRILGRPAWDANGKTIRMHGYGRQDVLSTDSDSCALNSGYVIAQAAYELAFEGLDRDTGLAQKVLLFQQQADRARRGMRTYWNPASRAVRLV